MRKGMNGKPKLGNLDKSVPFSAPEAIRIAVAVRNVALISVAVEVIVLLIILVNTPNDPQEMLLMKIAICGLIILFIPLTFLTGSMTAILYEAMADLVIDIRRIRLLRQGESDINWNE